jgi:hypothetical protein
MPHPHPMGFSCGYKPRDSAAVLNRGLTIVVMFATIAEQSQLRGLTTSERDCFSGRDEGRGPALPLERTGVELVA